MLLNCHVIAEYFFDDTTIGEAVLPNPRRVLWHARYGAVSRAEIWKAFDGSYARQQIRNEERGGETSHVGTPQTAASVKIKRAHAPV